MQLNQLKHKQLLPQIHFSTTTHDNQIKPVHYLVKYETVIPSQNEDNCHSNLADFGNDQFSNRVIDEEENIIIEPLDSFSFEAVKQVFQSQNNKPIKKISNF